ncbi:hypothetical protein PV327_008283 [Microctonus hyperodae]|uniref:Protein dead ringer n=1 Tax=Microctonus hyperodae TaxID=165561 RepID=A0AA39F2R7_MICHY|nr:hypothetical protein PV327_008283 [Microctonus hyperodae]
MESLIITELTNLSVARSTLLYEINDDPKRKEFLDDLFSFMQKRGTPINRLPIMAKSVLDLYELYNLVIARGGLVDVINKKLWQEIIKGLHLPSSITSAAFTLRTQYMKYLYPYECDRQQLSTQLELQAAIDGNRREGRRSSYGAYSGPDFDSRMVEYVKLINKELRGGGGGGSPPPSLPPPPPPPPPITSRQSGATSPSETSPRDSALSALEFSRMTLWNMYNNNGMYPNIGHHTPISPHISHSPHTRPSSPEQREALDLGLRSSPNSTSPNRHSPISGINLHHKREHDIDSCGPPPLKRSLFDDDVNNVNDKPVPTFAGTHIKISNRGDNKTGDNSLVVSMELNGVMYQGVLFAQGDNKSRANATNNNTKSRSVLL